MKVDQKLNLEAETEPVVVMNAESEYVACNQLASDFLNRENIIGASVEDFVITNKVKAGCELQKVLNGEQTTSKFDIKCGNGSALRVKCKGKPISIEDETFAMFTLIEFEEIKPADPDSGNQSLDSDTFENLSTERLQEIVQNIRIDSPDGKMTLNAVMLDLAISHNELEKFKKGAMSIQEAINQRLQEEKKKNPDSDECAVLREVQDSAFGLYLRIERGDEELHGHREGEYSGYFN